MFAGKSRVRVKIACERREMRAPRLLVSGALTIISGLSFSVAKDRLQMTQTAPSPAVSVLVLPHRSLSRAGLVGFLVAQGAAIGIFAMLAALGGNVFAPGFAILAMWLVAYCFMRIWRRSGAGQVVTMTPSQLEVATTSGASSVRFHPYWTKVRLEQGPHRGWPARLLVGSHGRDIEIGAFLNEQERRELAQRMTELLRDMQDRGGPQDTSVQGDNE
jgi:uncharacterized membrane protein